jgi:DNA-binding response OmpR family regulator
MRDPVPTDAPVPISNPKVLLIEDNPAVAETLQRFIERSGMRTAWAQTGAAAIELKRTFLPDVVLVDLELPDTNGVSLIGWLSQMQDCGIIVVSGRGEESERIVGLELGADDYIAKPPQLREMVARIRAVHRRAQGRGQARAAAPPVQTSFIAGEFRIDTARHSVIGPDGNNVALTAAEFTALQTLLEAGNQPVSRERLSEAALRRPWRAEDRSIDQLIFSLRRKLGDGERGQRMIQSVRGAGYILIPDAANPPDVQFDGK